VAIEWGGPVRWARNDPGHVMGKAVVKECLIKAMGWTYVKVGQLQVLINTRVGILKSIIGM